VLLAIAACSFDPGGFAPGSGAGGGDGGPGGDPIDAADAAKAAADANPAAPDANPAAPDATPGVADAAPGVADAAQSSPDAAPSPPDAATCTGCAAGLEVCGPGGACECASGLFECSSISGTCDDILSDPRTCGTSCGSASGHSCKNSQMCSGGACVCRPGLVLIGDKCVDTLTNPAACGPLGASTVPCDSAPYRCNDGVCATVCDPGEVDCLDGAWDDMGTCVDRNTHPKHCGACGKRCQEFEVCIAGACEDYLPTGDCAACPCPRCNEVFGGSGPCCDYGGEPVCVDGPACP
jgi:hypothetical protein